MREKPYLREKASTFVHSRVGGERERLCSSIPVLKKTVTLGWLFYAYDIVKKVFFKLCADDGII